VENHGRSHFHIGTDNCRVSLKRISAGASERGRRPGPARVRMAGHPTGHYATRRQVVHPGHRARARPYGNLALERWSG